MVADTVDENQSIQGHKFTTGWLLTSLRENDTAYKKLHGSRGVKEVNFLLEAN